MARLTPEKRLEKAKAAKARAEAEIRSAAAKLRAEDRKADTRRKIILGGIMLAQSKKRPDLRDWITRHIASLPDRDRAAFDGWSVPAEEPSPERGLS